MAMLCLEHVSLEFFERKVGDLSEKMEDEFLLVRRNECYIYLPLEEDDIMHKNLRFIKGISYIILPFPEKYLSGTEDGELSL